MDRETFKRLAWLRLREAKALLERGYYQGAYYLCGYAVECGLKACLAKKTRRYAFPPDPKKVREGYWTHELKNLLKEVGDPLAAEMKNNPNWAEATKWSEETRYSLDATQTMARNLYTAVAERKTGVLTCIRKYW